MRLRSIGVSGNRDGSGEFRGLDNSAKQSKNSVPSVFSVVKKTCDVFA